MKLDDAFNDLKAAFADLQLIQKKVDAQRAQCTQVFPGTDGWVNLDGEFNSLQKDWDSAHRRFKAALSQFNILVSGVVSERDGAPQYPSIRQPSIDIPQVESSGDCTPTA